MRKKVLIFPSGAENALEINEAIKYSIHVEVIPASGRNDYSELIYENEVRKLPFLNELNFIEDLNKLIEKDKIDLIFPTDDTASLFLVENASIINAKILSADFKTNLVCRYKKETYTLFKDEFFCPQIYLKVLEEEEYPIFSKPDVGQGSQGVQLIKSKKHHESLIDNNDLIFVEYLPGKEYTIDCFTDRYGELLFSGIRERAEVKMGISFRSREVYLTDEVKQIAEKINSKLGFQGLWFFQLKEDCNGHLKLLEVSTRTAGTMGFFRHKGVNLPLLTIYDALGMDVEIFKYGYELELFRVTKNKFKYGLEYDTVYVDYDDTLIVNGKVNIVLMSFIYQCKNNGKIVKLITKHGSKLHMSLNFYSISPSLFDEIIVLKMEDKKSDYIESHKAIFIDNWFVERREVRLAKDMPVFDVDTVESLIKN
ncbi:ATP-grasp domain-containing protein [Flavobacterium alkalisoli]|uniref:ATP-grasp domain-containing protein n=1 Tax=Flavobacterium alkalisoli TaxID=2602769 RepID=UPI003A925607